MNAGLEHAHVTLAGGRRSAAGDQIYAAGDPGTAWRIDSGVVRLDRPGPQGFSFAGLGLKGDLIGVESQLSGQYGFAARALSDCRLLPWSPTLEAPAGDTLVGMLAAIERRGADALALRCGEAADRVQLLFRLLADKPAEQGTIQITIPSLRDIADMTGLTRETASRAISHFIRSGRLIKLDRHTGLVEVGDF